jgi:hypothetical protein
LSNVTTGVYVAAAPCCRLSVDGVGQATVKLNSVPERVSVRLPLWLPTVASTRTVAADMLTTTVDCCAAAVADSPICQLTADASTERVAAVVLHAAVT